METAARCGAAVARARRHRHDRRDPVVLPWLGTEDPLRTAGKDVAASSVTPAFGMPAETKKALYVVALSRSTLRSVGEPDPKVMGRRGSDHGHVRIWAGRKYAHRVFDARGKICSSSREQSRLSRHPGEDSLRWIKPAVGQPAAGARRWGRSLAVAVARRPRLRPASAGSVRFRCRPCSGGRRRRSRAGRPRRAGARRRPRSGAASGRGGRRGGRGVQESSWYGSGSD